MLLNDSIKIIELTLQLYVCKYLCIMVINSFIWWYFDVIIDLMTLLVLLNWSISLFTSVSKSKTIVESIWSMLILLNLLYVTTVKKYISRYPGIENIFWFRKWTWIPSPICLDGKAWPSRRSLRRSTSSTFPPWSRRRRRTSLATKLTTLRWLSNFDP